MLDNLNAVSNNNALMTNLSVKKAEITAAASISANTKKSDTAEQSEGRFDTFEKSLFPKDEEGDDGTGIYSENTIAAQLKDVQNQREEAFKDFIRSLITDQAEEANFSFMGLDLKVTEADSQKALESISEGGEYSIDSVATRIMDMAEALAGGDQTKLALLRNAVSDGFGEAAKRLGLKDEEMPDITRKTYDEVMMRFDKWEQSFNPTDAEDTENAEKTAGIQNTEESATE